MVRILPPARGRGTGRPGPARAGRTPAQRQRRHPQRLRRPGQPATPWSLDLLPLIITSAEWAGPEAGVLQRAPAQRHPARPLRPQRLLRGPAAAGAGAGPPGLPARHAWRRPLARPCTWSRSIWRAAPTVAGWVVSHRTQSPVRSRLPAREPSPSVASSRRHSMRWTSSAWARATRAETRPAHAEPAAGADARIALLTPGPTTKPISSMFTWRATRPAAGRRQRPDGARPARSTSTPLHGLEPIDVLPAPGRRKRLDPLELRPDSALGVPGLMRRRCARRSSCCQAIAPGLALQRTTNAMWVSCPAISRACTASHWGCLCRWWCGEAASLRTAWKRWPRSVVKRTIPGQQRDRDRGLLPVVAPPSSGRGASGAAGPVHRAVLPAVAKPTWRARGDHYRAARDHAAPVRGE